MKRITKAFITALSFILIFSLLPIYVFADGGMGTENPKIEAVFTDSNGEKVCGDFLENGDYTVNITLSDIAAISVFQFSADFNSNGKEDISINSISTIADTNEQFKCGGIKNEENSFAVIIASLEEKNTPIQNGEAMITMSVTVKSASDAEKVDFEKVFLVSEDPELTFVQSSYENGFEASYVCKSNEATETDYPQLSYDMSPDLSVKTITVTGKITISEDREGTSGKYGVPGIKVSANGEEVAESASDGAFTAVLPKGTTELTLSGETTVDRIVSLSGESDISGVNIPIITCNFERSDDVIDGTDTGLFLSHIGTDNVYANLEASDETVDGTDTGLFLNFLSNDQVVYSELSLD